MDSAKNNTFQVFKKIIKIGAMLRFFWLAKLAKVSRNKQIIMVHSVTKYSKVSIANQRTSLVHFPFSLLIGNQENYRTESPTILLGNWSYRLIHC